MPEYGAYDEADALTGDETILGLQGGQTVGFDLNRVASEVAAQPLRVGGMSIRPADLDAFLAVVETARTSPVNIVVIGDSVAVGGTEGNASTAKPWTMVLEAELNRLVELPAPGGYIPAAVSAVGPHVDTSTGAASSQDFANKASTISAAQYVEHAFSDIDRVAVVYRRQPGSSTIRVRDGGSGGTILDTINANGASAYSQIWTSDAIAAGAHTIYADSGGGGGTQVIAGFYGFRGNFDKGFRVWPAAKSGATSATAVLGLSNGYASDLIAAVDPDLIIYNTGFNDDDDFDANMRSLLDAYLPLAPNASHVMMIPYLLPTQGDRWDEARVANARTIADEYEIAKIDLSVLTPDMSLDGASSRFLFDSTHPNAAGSRRMGVVAAAILSGDPISYAIKIADVGWYREADTAIRTLDVVRAASGVADGDLITMAQRPRDAIFGDGSDGPRDNAGTFNMTRDMQWTDVSGSGTINTNGWRVMIKGTLSGSVKFAFDGAAASGVTAGAGVTGWYWSSAGGAGGTAAGSNATATTPNKCLGAAGGVGGTGSSGAGGTAAYSSIVATGSGVAIADVSKIAPMTLWIGRTMAGNIVPQSYLGGSGGGGGGGDGTAGGGGGAGGGACIVFAYDCRTWTGDMSAVGGAGASPAGGNRGGGAGGGGGFIGLVTALGEPASPGARTVTGGAGAAGTGTGTAGANGSTGTAVTLLVS